MAKVKAPAVAVPAVVPSVSITPVNPSNILTIDEVAARLKVTRRVVYGLTRSHSENPIPFFRVGKVLRFNWLAVSVWLEQPQREAA